MAIIKCITHCVWTIPMIETTLRKYVSGHGDQIVMWSVLQICSDHKLCFQYLYSVLSVSVLKIKLTGITLKISTVRFECIILILESPKYVLTQT